MCRENSKQRRERIAKELEARETFFKVYVPIIAAFVVLLIALVVYRTSFAVKKPLESLEDFEKTMNMTGDEDELVVDAED